MTKTINIQESTIINASLETVWRACAEDFVAIDKWDANVRESEPLQPEKSTSNDRVSGRICHQYSGRKTVEELIEFDDHSRTFTYSITKGLPGFVILATNKWSMGTIKPKETRLSMNLTMEVRGFMGWLLSKPVRSQMSKILKGAQEELKYFIETGEPHARKRKKK